MEIKTNASDRKALVKAIAEITGAEAKYDGPPKFTYTVDYFVIGRDNAITFDDSADSEEVEHLIEELSERGFIERTDEVEELEISVPIEGMNGDAFRNLLFMLHSKQYLLNRVTRRESFAVSDELIATLGNDPPNGYEAFCAALSADTGELKGIRFDEDKVTFTFPISDDPAKNRAYAELSAFMVARAKDAGRVTATEQKPENEKYYLRSWLLRLGLTGEGGKASRKALLAGLKGHTAFRTPVDAEKHTGSPPTVGVRKSSTSPSSSARLSITR